ncbi:uncharacterized protein EV422DRAFT_271871 [Fimicolochytrium jonesii]|uniref:uncharacterized protein n=1 Tax=Fimicolochytrium jonesii TaxID=1396493 RepID=UPI0022FDB6C5|nr:uncharacterized protein EV422DRAFT_271871 [Fimicolochytrium jonesii]KAI8816837.1 hypothetical protein EV422DRAFT_271871 [Fimicolochytrium jonesii]
MAAAAMAANSLRGYLTPTDLNSYHTNLCKKFLWLADEKRGGTKGDSRNPLHKKAPPPPQALTEARFGKGNQVCTPIDATAGSSDARRLRGESEANWAKGTGMLEWERRLRERLKKEHLILAGPGSPPISIEELVNLIKRDHRPHFYIVDLTFQSPDFDDQLKSRNSPPKSVRFGTFKPDFLEIWLNRDDAGALVEIKFRVIDAKASRKVKVSHQVQVGFYWLALTELFKDWREKSDSSRVEIVPDEIGEIWIPAKGTALDICDVPSPKGSFPLLMLQPLLETFLFEELSRLLSTDLTNVPWHLNPLCQGCEFLPRCRAETVREKRLGKIPHLSGADAVFLKEVIQTYGSGKRSELEDLESIVRVSALRDDFPAYKRLERMLAISNVSFQPAGRVVDAASRAVSDEILGPATDELARVEKSTDWANQPGPTFGAGHDTAPKSSVLTAALQDKVAPLLRSCLIFPREEDISVYLTLGVDPETDRLYAFSILASDSTSDAKTIHETSAIANPNPLAVFQTTFIESLATLIKMLLDRKESQAPEPVRVQFYVFTRADSDTLAQILVDEAIRSPECTEAAKLCIGALLTQSSVLLTSVQPELLASGLLLKVRKTDRVDEIRRYLRIFGGSGIDVTGAKEVMLARLSALLERGGNPAGRESGLQRMLPKVAVLHECVRALVALPIPGFYGIDGAYKYLLGDDATGEDTDIGDTIYSTYKATPTIPILHTHLKRHGSKMLAIATALRHLISTSTLSSIRSIHDILPNTARDFSVTYIDVCHHPTLRKLLFMAQYEVTVELQSLIHDRLSNTHTTRLVYHGDSNFTCTSGSEYVDVSTTTEWRKYGYIITKNHGTEVDVAAVGFDDLAFAGAYGPLIRGGETWGVAEVVEMDSSSRVKIAVRAGRDFLQEGEGYILRKRMVNFNTAKVIKSLLAIDQASLGHATMPFFTRLLDEDAEMDPPPNVAEDAKLEARLQTTYREYYTLKGGDRPLLLATSQRKAFKEILERPIAVIWGPPGHGKTHTLALAALRLMEITGRRSNARDPFRVLVTSATNSGVDTLLRKFEFLLSNVRQVEGLESPWRDLVQVSVLPKDATKMPKPADLPTYAVVGGTVWGIYKWRERLKHIGDAFQCLIIDEGSQMTVSEAAIAIDTVMQNGTGKRLIVAGDHLQLPPVLKGGYPDETRLFGSVLEWLVEVDADSEEKRDRRMTMLQENFRMVRDLCRFSNELYKRGGVFLPMRAGEEGADFAAEVLGGGDMALVSSPIVQSPTAALPSCPRTTILLPEPHARLEDQLQYEANIVAQLVRSLQLSDVDGTNIKVITPHRVQRSLVTRVLRDAGLEVEVVDTVERVQGTEADVVIVCYGFAGCRSYHESTLTFTYHLRRLNVALSRARDRCILIGTRELLYPPLSVVGTGEMRDALARVWGFLKAGLIRTWGGRRGSLMSELSVDGEAALGYGSFDEEALSRMMTGLGV